MRFALVHYDVSRIANEPGNKTVMKHFGHMPNIQLLYVASVLESLGVEIAYYDMVGMELSEADVLRGLKKFDPDFIGLSVYTSHFHNAKSYAAYFKSHLPRTAVMLGGVHAQIFPVETLLHNPDVDYACIGEAEMVLPEFVRRWRSGEGFDDLPGLVWRDGEDIRFAGPAEPCQGLDAVPFPARHLVPNHKYFNFISTRRNYTVFNTSRGCPFRCIFCEAAGSKWRARSAQSVVAEFEECYEDHGVREVDIFDSSFTVSKRRVLEICRRLVSSGLNRKMIWDVRSRVDTIDEEMLEALKEAGCYRIFYGIESGSPQVLKKLRKEISIDRIRKIIRKTDRLGISPFGYFLVGSPGDTRETIQETIDFAKELPLDFAIFNCLTAFPQTELYERYYLPVAASDFWAEYITRSLPDARFMGRPWVSIGDAELRRMAHRAMNQYYFRPRQLWRAMRSVKSLDQLRRYCAAGRDMLWSYVRSRNSVPKREG
ncbi:MAG: B12-binding domain-containing radical SAM protein [Proteobacteria bacterium]|nr:B12-binding domain-containing radical SAM protein [Pseudomonadota bacterium]MBU1741280.1 B12-binding domain-containing radical SAM protein [Pseudomonadota bacterium]